MDMTNISIGLCIKAKLYAGIGLICDFIPIYIASRFSSPIFSKKLYVPYLLKSFDLSVITRHLRWEYSSVS